MIILIFLANERYLILVTKGGKYTKSDRDYTIHGWFGIKMCPTSPERVLLIKLTYSGNCNASVAFKEFKGFCNLHDGEMSDLVLRAMIQKFWWRRQA